MIIAKAIEILTLDKTCDFEGSSQELEDAIQLGIEALKIIVARRDLKTGWEATPLPGETTD